MASRQVVVAASAEAQTHGVREGMTLAEARALCPGLLDAVHEVEKDLRGLEGLARWMMRFSPIVMVESGIDQHGLAAHATRPPAVFLDVTGCERVFGGMQSLVEQVAEAIRRMGVQARVTVAPTPGAAWAVAFGGSSGSIVTDEQVRKVLAPLPPKALRIEWDVVETLYHLGIESIGQLLDLPRTALPPRFGQALLRRIDQALGRVPEPLVGIAHDVPVEARIDFDGVVDSLEAIWMVFERLIATVTAELSRRGCGARKLEVRFFRSYAPVIVKTILLSRPSREARNLFNLMRCAMETLEGEARGHGGAKARRGRSQLARVSDEDMTPAGFTGVALSVPVFEPVAQEQVCLAEREDHDGQVELDHLLERLMLRLGEEAVVRPVLTEAYVPERAWRGVPVHESRPDGPCHVTAVRPLYLLDRPEEIARVMVSPSHDRDGRPISFTRGSRVHEVVHCAGPERIGGQWWEGHHRTRDYFAVEDRFGKRHWIFRVQETNRWYVHGEFE